MTEAELDAMGALAHPPCDCKRCNGFRTLVREVRHLRAIADELRRLIRLLCSEDTPLDAEGYHLCEYDEGPTIKERCYAWTETEEAEATKAKENER
jgi:hypothetical protein